MREIKFRGKRMDNGEWAYGWYLQTNTGHHSIANIGKNMLPQLYEVDPATVGQYTGFKDKNGKKIYEGDIVFCRAGETYHGSSEYEATFPVEYGWTQSMWEMQQCETIEVIGNIHDYPHLLEVAQPAPEVEHG